MFVCYSEEFLSTRVSRFSFVTYQMLRWPEPQVTAACSSCNPPGLNFSKLYSLPSKPLILFLQNMQFFINTGNQNSMAPSLKRLLIAIPMSSLPLCSYEKDKRAKPGNLRTEISEFSPPPSKPSLAFLRTFHFHLLYSLLLCFLHSSV